MTKWLLLGGAAAAYLHHKGRQRIKSCCNLEAKAEIRHDQCLHEASTNVIDTIRLGIEELQKTPFPKSNVETFRKWCRFIPQA